MNKQDERIFLIREVLLENGGAVEVKEIVNLLLNIGERANENMINGDLARIRYMWNTDQDYFKFTIPHSKRGPNIIGDKRFMVLDKNNIGSRFPDGDQRYESLNDGMNNTLQEAATKLARAADAFVLAADQYSDKSATSAMWKFIAKNANHTSELIRDAVDTLPKQTPTKKKKIVLDLGDLDEAA